MGGRRRQLNSAGRPGGCSRPGHAGATAMLCAHCTPFPLLPFIGAPARAHSPDSDNPHHGTTRVYRWHYRESGRPRPRRRHRPRPLRRHGKEGQYSLSPAHITPSSLTRSYRLSPFVLYDRHDTCSVPIYRPMTGQGRNRARLPRAHCDGSATPLQASTRPAARRGSVTQASLLLVRYTVSSHAVQDATSTFWRKASKTSRGTLDSIATCSRA